MPVVGGVCTEGHIFDRDLFFLEQSCPNINYQEGFDHFVGSMNYLLQLYVKNSEVSFLLLRTDSETFLV